jgi:hypothetical protein
MACSWALDPALIEPVIDAAVKYKAIAAAFDARAMIDPAIPEVLTRAAHELLTGCGKTNELALGFKSVLEYHEGTFPRIF